MLRLGLVVLVLVLGAGGSAWAGPILGGSVVDARLCADPACDVVTMTPGSERPTLGPVTGTVEIDPAILQIDFNLFVDPIVLQGRDGIWLGLELHDVRLQGSFALCCRGSVPITEGAAQAEGVALGSHPATLPALIPFSTEPALSGTGRVPPGGGRSDFQMIFGPDQFAIPFGETRYLTVTLNLIVPEPETILLLAVGLVMVGCARRRPDDVTTTHHQRERTAEQ